MKFKVTCFKDEDLNGIWDKKDVEAEMRELGIDISSDTSWLEYIVDHVFDGYDMKDTIYDAIIDLDIQNIIFKLDNVVVKAEKFKW